MAETEEGGENVDYCFMRENHPSRNQHMEQTRSRRGEEKT